MRQVLALAVFMLATLVWTMAQQPGASGGTSPSSQTPRASQSQPSQSQPSQSQPSQSQPSAPGSAGQGSSQTGSAQSQDPAQRGAGSAGPAANAPITEGCLGGSNPNFTITDKAGTTYKLNIPAGADTSVLTPHIGESVQVMGQITNGGGAGKVSSIDVGRIGRGTGSCPANSSKQPNR